MTFFQNSNGIVTSKRVVSLYLQKFSLVLQFPRILRDILYALELMLARRDGVLSISRLVGIISAQFVHYYVYLLFEWY